MDIEDEVSANQAEALALFERRKRVSTLDITLLIYREMSTDTHCLLQIYTILHKHTVLNFFSVLNFIGQANSGIN